MNKFPAEGKHNFSRSSLFLGFGAFIEQTYWYSVFLKGFLKNKYFRARTPNDIHYRKEEGKNPYKPLFYIHTASLVLEKNDYMPSRYFLRYVLGINNKKHANFMDGEPDISKS